MYCHFELFNWIFVRTGDSPPIILFYMILLGLSFASAELDGNSRCSNVNFGLDIADTKITVHVKGSLIVHFLVAG